MSKYRCRRFPVAEEAVWKPVVIGSTHVNEGIVYIFGGDSYSETSGTFTIKWDANGVFKLEL